MRIAVAGGGAFGTALAISMADDGKDVQLWVRSPDAAKQMTATRINPRLPMAKLPEALRITSDPDQLIDAEVVLLAVPAQQLRGFLVQNVDRLRGRHLVACCKGIDLETLTGPSAVIRDSVPGAKPAVLTGPSFAVDIAMGLPTALTLASASTATGELLQETLATQTLRLYRTTDVIGAELGGALKNVIAIACGITIGAQLGDSARAALMTRGFSEMQRLAAQLGANPQTLTGLSGLGDLALTCTSPLSRNYSYGLAFGANADFDITTTIEGAATAVAVDRLAVDLGLDLPVCWAIARLIEGEIDVTEALKSLLSRPLKEE